MKKIIKKSKKILEILLFLLLIFSVFILVTSKTALLFGLRSFVVLSGSMEPSLPVGSLVFVRKSTDYKLNDVVSYTDKRGQVVTHRVIEKTEKEGNKYFRLKGDANNSPDSDLIEEKSIIGRKLFTLPFIGRFIQFLRTLPGFLTLIILPSLIFIGFELWNIKKEMEKEIEKKILKKIKTT